MDIDKTKRPQVKRIISFSDYPQIDLICKQKIPFGERIDLMYDFLLSYKNEDFKNKILKETKAAK